MAYTFFRYEWIRKIIVKALSRPNDPVLTPEKLMEIGVFAGYKSPSKALIFDWENWMAPIKKNQKFIQIQTLLDEASD